MTSLCQTRNDKMMQLPLTPGNSNTLFQGARLMRFFLLLLLCLSSSASAESVEMWLDKMNTAVHGLNYKGTYVYISNDRIDTMQIVHSVDGDGERERLLSLNGEAREILSLCDEVASVWPKDPDVINRVATVYGLAGKLDRAEEYARRALEIEPDRGEFHATLAKIHKDAGNKGHALASVKRALELNPGDMEARRMLESLMSRNPARKPANGGMQ